MFGRVVVWQGLRKDCVPDAEDDDSFVWAYCGGETDMRSHKVVINNEGEIVLWESSFDRPENFTQQQHRRFNQVAFTNSAAVAVTDQGSIYVWSQENSQPLLNSTQTPCPSPSCYSYCLYNEMDFDKGKVLKVALGYKHLLAMTNRGDVFSWGDNAVGQLGVNTFTPLSEPEHVQVKEKVCDIAAGKLHSMVLCVDQQAYTFGDDEYGQLGRLSSKRDSCLPVPIKVPNVNQIACGWYHSAVVSNRKQLFVFGSNRNGQLGIGAYDDVVMPRMVKQFGDDSELDIWANAKSTFVQEALPGLDERKVYVSGSSAKYPLGTTRPNYVNLLSPSPSCTFLSFFSTQDSVHALIDRESRSRLTRSIETFNSLPEIFLDIWVKGEEEGGEEAVRVSSFLLSTVSDKLYNLVKEYKKEKKENREPLLIPHLKCKQSLMWFINLTCYNILPNLQEDDPQRKSLLQLKEATSFFNINQLYAWASWAINLKPAPCKELLKHSLSMVGSTQPFVSKDICLETSDQDEQCQFPTCFAPSSDIVLLVDRLSLYCHKVILIESPPLRERIVSDPHLKKMSISLNIADSAAFLQAFKFLYTDRIVIESVNQGLSLLSVAHQFSLKRLYKILTAQLEKDVNVTNAVSILLRARGMATGPFFSLLLQFIKKNKASIKTLDQLTDQELTIIGEPISSRKSTSWCECFLNFGLCPPHPPKYQSMLEQ